MYRALQNESSTRLHLYRRLAWLILLGAHLPGVLRRFSDLFAAQTEAVSAGFVLLLLACVFFALKIVDVPWLHFKTDRRSCVVLILAAALMHANVLKFADQPAGPPQPEILLFQAAVLGTLLVSRLLVPRLIRGHAQRALPLLRLIPQWPLLIRQRCLSIAAQCAHLSAHPDRAPPVRA